MTRTILVLALVLGLSACGATALQTNATVSTTAAAALDLTGDAIVSTRRAEEERALTAAPDRATAAAAVDVVRHRWAPAVAAHDLAAAAQRAYADGIVAVAAGLKPIETLASLLAPLAAAWRSAVAALAPLGVTLPSLPGAL